jgi:hypothetical protein
VQSGRGSTREGVTEGEELSSAVGAGALDVAGVACAAGLG